MNIKSNTFALVVLISALFSNVTGQNKDCLAFNFRSELFTECDIIGLGEESHGIKTINEHRNLIAFSLIQNYEVKYIAWEQEFGSLSAVNDGLNQKQPNFEQLIKHFTWFWQTEETTDLLRHIHQHNLEYPDKKIKLVGIDLSSNLTTYRACYNFFHPYISNRSILDEYSTFKPKFEKYKNLNKKDVGKLQRISDQLMEELFSNPIYKEKYSREAIQIIRMHINNLYQFPPYFQKNQFPRDEIMYVNLTALRNICHESEKIVVFAHNGHISKSDPYTNSMGMLLANHFSSKYYAMGFEFGEGNFVCTKTNASKLRILMRGMVLKKNVSKFYESTIGNLPFNPASSSLQYLGSQPQQFLFYDVHQLEYNSELQNLLTTEQLYHDIGTVCPEFENAFSKKKWSDHFDGMYFIRYVEASEKVKF